MVLGHISQRKTTAGNVDANGTSITIRNTVEKAEKATRAKAKEDNRKAERILGGSRTGTSSSRGSAPGTIRCPGGSGSMGTKEIGTKEEKAKAKEKERAATGATTARGTATRDGDAGG